MLRNSLVALTTAIFLVCANGIGHAQTAQTTTSTNDRASDRHDWGWLGLIGLIGLAGLGGRRRETVATRRAPGANSEPL
jgi:hypothetical protein